MSDLEGNHDRAALIVASWDYSDDRLRQLRSPSHDADRLADLLGDGELGDFNVEVLRNQGVLAVKRRIETFLRLRSRNDLTLLYFSGHGVLDERHRYFIATSDTDLDALASTGIDREFINGRIDDCRSRRVVLLLDTCHSGAFGKDSGFKSANRTQIGPGFSGEGRVVISASGPLEYAFEADPGSDDPSIFTAALIRGIESGDADRDGNSLVTVDELYDYLCNEVSGQRPTLSGHVSGDLVVAQVPARRRPPAPLPDDIRRAIASEDRISRLGAIARLERLLEAEDPALVKAARLELADLEDDDSRQVSDAASAALGRHPSEPLVDQDGGHNGVEVPAVSVQQTHAEVAARIGRDSRPMQRLTTKCLHTVPAGGHVNCVAFSPDESLLAAGTSRPSLILMDTISTTRLVDRGGMYNVNAVAWSSDGSSIAFTTGGKLRVLRRALESTATDGATASAMWKADDSTVLAHGWKVYLRDVAYQGDNFIVTAGKGTTWWQGTDKLGHVDTEHDIYTIATTPPAHGIIAAGRADGVIQLRHLPTGELTRTLKHDALVRSVAFSYDGRLLASGGDDRSLRLWEVESGNELFRRPRSDFVRSVAFDWSGRYLATGDDTKEAVIWDTASLQPIAVCHHPDWVYAVAFSSSGQYLATGCRDKNVRIFSIEPG